MTEGRDTSARRAELAAFLRARRAGLRPADVGLPDDLEPGLRRTPGLRREEVAGISGVGVTWYTRLRHDPMALPPDRRNLLWMMFTDAENRARMPRWEPAARAVLSQFRAAAGRRAGDPRFAFLAAELTEASPEFRRWWAEYPVRSFRPATVQVEHPGAGRLDLEMFQLRPDEHPDLLMVLQVPASEDVLQRVTALLAGPRDDGDDGPVPAGAPGPGLR